MNTSASKVTEDFFIFRSKLSPQTIRGYSVNSRTIKPGELFIALKGEKSDGHDYLDEAKQKGAIGAIVSREYTRIFDHFPVLQTEDPLFALQEIAAEAVRKSGMRPVAITGSIGKTTTKEFVRTLLSSRYRVAASPGNQNSQIGVPLSILNSIETEGNAEILVLEMGMSSPGHLSRLVQIAPPEVAVLTHVAPVHAEFFNGLEEISRAKGEIFSNPRTRAGIICADIPVFEEISKIGVCRKISFSLTSSGSDYGIDSIDSSVLKERFTGFSFPVMNFSLPGKHNVHNLLASIAVARYFDIEPNLILETIPRLTLPPGRLQSTVLREIKFINDSYNACEASCKAALEVLSESGSGKKIAVLGGMEELGSFSLDCHLRVGRFALARADAMYCLGEESYPIYELWKQEGRTAYFFHDRSRLVDRLREDLRPGNTVLLKGSFSKELGSIPEELWCYGPTVN